MCGIVGLFLKNPDLEAALGQHLATMLAGMTERGPDSAGFAVYREPAPSGSVKVTLRNVIEYYSHVMHIVSNVEGKIDPKYDAMDALAAGFPAGTVSGAPKVRAMEIIEELEPERRGLYAGAVGYFGAGGAMDTCIALRTAVVKEGVMYVQAGGGIVADSSPEGEYQESRNKAQALLRAAQEAVRFAAGRG